MNKFLLSLIAGSVLALTTTTWACPTCALAASFTPKTLLLSLIFAGVPMGLMLFLGYRVYQEEQYRMSSKKTKK